LTAVTPDALPAIGRQIVLTMLTATLAVPAAWVATLGRSLLAGIGTTIVILVLFQVAVITGADGWFTPAAPALWAASGGTRASSFQIALVVPLLVISCGLTLTAWRRLQLDR
jgi:ABC-2 type transport system permease protein